MEEVNSLEVNNSLDRAISSCAGFNFRKVSRVVTQYFDDALKPSGLLITQFTVLVAVAKVKAISINELAEILMMDRTTLTRNLKPLVRQAWLEIEPGQDRRTRIIRLTIDGKQVLAKALPLWQQAQDSVVAFLGEDQWSRLLSQLARVTELPHQG